MDVRQVEPAAWIEGEGVGVAPFEVIVPRVVEAPAAPGQRDRDVVVRSGPAHVRGADLDAQGVDQPGVAHAADPRSMIVLEPLVDRRGVAYDLAAEAHPHAGEPPAAGPAVGALADQDAFDLRDRKSTRLNSSHGSISYAVFC